MRDIVYRVSGRGIRININFEYRNRESPSILNNYQMLYKMSPSKKNEDITVIYLVISWENVRIRETFRVAGDNYIIMYISFDSGYFWQEYYCWSF